MTRDDYYFVEEGYFWGHYGSLNEHLLAIKPIIDCFCETTGFRYEDRRAIGRGPRVRIRRGSQPMLWFDLWMELDEDGRAFETFQQDRPYELSCGAIMDDGEVRLYKMLVCFSGKPFHEVAGVLKVELDKALEVLEKWDVAYLRAHGEQEAIRAES